MNAFTNHKQYIIGLSKMFDVQEALKAGSLVDQKTKRPLESKDINLGSFGSIRVSEKRGQIYFSKLTDKGIPARIEMHAILEHMREVFKDLEKWESDITLQAEELGDLVKMKQDLEMHVISSRAASKKMQDIQTKSSKLVSEMQGLEARNRELYTKVKSLSDDKDTIESDRRFYVIISYTLIVAIIGMGVMKLVQKFF